MSRKMLPKRGREDDDPRVRCSKTLSYLLRHGAVQSGLKMTSDGYAAVADILAFPQFKDCTAEMIRDLVANDAKMRYSLRDVDGKMEICANQGHSLAVAVALRPITSSTECPQAIHGTYKRFMSAIMSEGLRPMGRQHIHFSQREPTERNDVSGIRRSCDVLIFLNVEKALADGIPLFESANGVILSPGNGNGCVPRAYFLKVIDRTTGAVWS